MNALFLHDEDDLAASVAGGVQLCTKEFLEIVRRAADKTIVFPVVRSKSLARRISRKAGFASYNHYDIQNYRIEIDRIIEDHQITTLFLNRSELVRFAPALKVRHPKIQTVLMSHGNQTGDDLYEIAGRHGRRRNGLSKIRAMVQLGLDLVTESEQRHRSVDTVAVMSSEEATLERWLGAKRVIVLPRLLKTSPLNWAPVKARVGYVGTLDHTPNRVALLQLLDELSKNPLPNLTLRLIGSPESIGQSLARDYPFVTYLGRLTDSELESEATSWELFLNPIFWLSRGASMKLAKALEWGLPILSTKSGVRGYEWQDAEMPITADNPRAFCRRLTELLNDSNQIEAAKLASEKALHSAPSIDNLAARLRNCNNS